MSEFDFMHPHIPFPMASRSLRRTPTAAQPALYNAQGRFVQADSTQYAVSNGSKPPNYSPVSMIYSRTSSTGATYAVGSTPAYAETFFDSAGGPPPFASPAHTLDSMMACQSTPGFSNGDGEFHAFPQRPAMQTFHSFDDYTLGSYSEITHQTQRNGYESDSGSRRSVFNQVNGGLRRNENRHSTILSEDFAILSPPKSISPPRTSTPHPHRLRKSSNTSRLRKDSSSHHRDAPSSGSVRMQQQVLKVSVPTVLHEAGGMIVESPHESHNFPVDREPPPRPLSRSRRSSTSSMAGPSNSRPSKRASIAGIPLPRRRHSDGDPNDPYQSAVKSSHPPTRPNTVLDLNRRNSDLDRAASMRMQQRNVHFNENPICPSPVLPCHRRQGWFNRRGDQLWTNDGLYKPSAPGEEFPFDLADYPDVGEGWMNEDGTRIDVKHRLIPKYPVRSALKRTVHAIPQGA
ncbi:hypothetical protein DL96DRAFT_1225723 [Flagelloscypha sp. PMI_526]|nr:hypothetical protein DL96DRAFT_1225723 [Flagelloscypha sp. PMI_526]